MKLKNLLILLPAFLLIFSCGGNDSNNSSYDAAKYAEIDDEKLIEYLQTHYLNEDDDTIWTIKNGESPLIDNIEVQNIVKDEVTYKLYYFKTEEEGVGQSPSTADSVLVTYAGMLLDSTVFDSSSSIRWFSLTNVIDGWSYGMTNFKAGNRVVNPDESFYYENYGGGYIFIPSGLAYRNIPQSAIPENSPLVFKLSLQDINLSDHDNDGILSIDEDINGDNNVKNDDTDNDNVPNYVDVDDDNDGTLTKDEDVNGDGDPTNDDTDGDGIPDYLDTDNS